MDAGRFPTRANFLFAQVQQEWQARLHTSSILIRHLARIILDPFTVYLVGALTESLTIALNPDLGNASPAQLPYLTLDTGYFRSDFPPSLNSASTDATMCPSDTVSLQPPTYLETMYSPGVKSVGSALMRMASNRRRRKRGEHPCLFPGCPADFSSLHNRECLYFSLIRYFTPADMETCRSHECTPGSSALQMRVQSFWMRIRSVSAKNGQTS